MKIGARIGSKSGEPFRRDSFILSKVRASRKKRSQSMEIAWNACLERFREMTRLQGRVDLHLQSQFARKLFYHVYDIGPFHLKDLRARMLTGQGVSVNADEAARSIERFVKGFALDDLLTLDSFAVLCPRIVEVVYLLQDI